MLHLIVMGLTNTVTPTALDMGAVVLVSAGKQTPNTSVHNDVLCTFFFFFPIIAKHSRIITSFDWLIMLCIMCPKMWFDLFAAPHNVMLMVIVTSPLLCGTLLEAEQFFLFLRKAIFFIICLFHISQMQQILLKF